MKYILALDIGIASVGWAVLDKESETVIEAGSNIFPEASAADNQLRRDMRGAKRNNRRLKTRINDFIKLWEKNNLSIPQFKSTEIYLLTLLTFPYFQGFPPLKILYMYPFPLFLPLWDNYKGKFIIQLFNRCLPLYQEVLRKSALLPL